MSFARSGCTAGGMRTQLLTVLAMALLSPGSGTAGSGALAELSAAPSRLPNVKPISASELKSAIQQGYPIRKRMILAGDLNTVINAEVGSKHPCDRGASLHVENSVIVGDVNFTAAATQPSDEKDEEVSADASNQALFLPIQIASTEIHGDVQLDKMDLGCDFNLSASTVTGEFKAHQAIFRSAFTADDATFRGNFLANQASWVGPVSMRRSTFRRNVEMFGPNDGDPASSTGTFSGDVDFDSARFEGYVNFMNAKLVGNTNFAYAQFLSEALFTYAEIDRGPKKRLSGPFYNTVFAGRASFHGAHQQSLTFLKTVFKDRAEFDRIKVGSLRFMRVSFSGPLDLSNAEINNLQFQGTILVSDDATFRDARIGKATLTRLRFLKGVDFQDAQFGSTVEFRSVAFKGLAMFEGALLVRPSSSEPTGTAQDVPMFVFSDSDFWGGLHLDPEQLRTQVPWWQPWQTANPRIVSGVPNEEPTTVEESLDDDSPPREPLDPVAKQRRFWRQLVHAFHDAGSSQLENENYSSYQLQLLGTPDKSLWHRVGEFMSRWFWGFGLRPLRVVVWLGFLITAFALLYTTQIAQANAGLNALLRRLWQALAFSARTAWTLSFGYQNAQTPMWRVIAVTESVISKAFLACFVYALSNTSPLLNELMKTIVPGL